MSVRVGMGLLYSCENPECPSHEHECRIPATAKAENARYVVVDAASGEAHRVIGEQALPAGTVSSNSVSLVAIGAWWSSQAQGVWRSRGGGFGLHNPIHEPGRERLEEHAEVGGGGPGGFGPRIGLPSFSDPLPRFPYAAVLGVDVPVLVLLCVSLLVLGMVAMPGRPRARKGTSSPVGGAL